MANARGGFNCLVELGGIEPPTSTLPVSYPAVSYDYIALIYVVLSAIFVLFISCISANWYLILFQTATPRITAFLVPMGVGGT